MGNPEQQPRSARLRGWWWALAIIVVAAGAVWGLRFLPKKSPVVTANTTPSVPAGVACLGHLEPGDGIVHVSAPYFSGRPSLVKELRVEEGERIRAGQIIAILDGRDQLQAAVAQSEARVAVARGRVAQVKAGAKPADLAALKAEIERGEATFENARTELRRFELLRQKQDVSQSEVDSRRTNVLTTERTIEEARQRLKSLSEVRPEDVALAEAELQSAVADAARVRADFDSTIVYSPISAQVIKVHAHAGEQVGPGGIVDLGQTDRMYAVAEVYESDVGRVRVGQRATVSGDLFASKIDGTVERIGVEVVKNEVAPNDPVSYSDARVIPVRIRLADSKPVAGFINAKVSVVFAP
jgi:HlyD family secretion protein